MTNKLPPYHATVNGREVEYVLDASDSDDPAIKFAALQTCASCLHYGLALEMERGYLVCLECKAAIPMTLPPSVQAAIATKKPAVGRGHGKRSVVTPTKATEARPQLSGISVRMSYPSVLGRLLAVTNAMQASGVSKQARERFVIDVLGGEDEDQDERMLAAAEKWGMTISD